MELRDSAYAVLEAYLRHLPIEEKIDVLTEFGKTANLKPTTAPSPSERAYALGVALEKVLPRLKIDDAEDVAKSLMLEFIRREIDRRVAEENTRKLNIKKFRSKSRPRNPVHRGPMKLVIADDGKPLMAADLSEFLMFFNRVYDLFLDFPEDEHPPGLVEEPSHTNREFYLRMLEAKLKRASTSQTSGSARPLVIKRIRKSSPLSIWFEAVVIGLTIAVILSGGEVDLVRGRFRVHALGDGLAKLKALFDRGATRAKKKKRITQKARY